jgi:hypothetical protein
MNHSRFACYCIQHLPVLPPILKAPINSNCYHCISNAADDDSIYMLPAVPLPDVLGQLPASEKERQALARSLLLDLVQDPGVAAAACCCCCYSYDSRVLQQCQCLHQR